MIYKFDQDTNGVELICIGYGRWICLVTDCGLLTKPFCDQTYLVYPLV